MFAFLGLLVSQCGSHRCELAAHRAVYHFIADLHPHREKGAGDYIWHLFDKLEDLRPILK